MTLFSTSVCAALCVHWMLNDASGEDRVYFGRKIVFHSENGSYVDGVLRHTVESDIASCIYECKRRPGCGYLNYHRQSLQCYLMRHLVQPETMTIEFSPGYVHGDKSDWKMDIPCSGCGMFETCEETSGSFQCKIRECGIPPEFPRSYLLGNMHTVGARNAYACTQYNEMTIYTTHISECLDNGIWSVPEFDCLDIDECVSSPCLNDGTCLDAINAYTCACGPGWVGSICEQDINECASNPCQNGGICTDGINEYTCTCVSGYTGGDCQTDINECASDPCLNDGTCTDGINEYTCTCVSGYTGGNCQTDINECATDPCLNGGTCTDGINEYTCTCVSGYTGGRCQTDINECASNQCKNGGTCTDGINGYTCTCVSGYTGGICQTNINECASNPCKNGGTCTDGINEYTCACFSGYTGGRCQTDINECASNPCKNGGTCTDGTNEYTCACVSGYTGGRCQTDINECASNPCQYGGTCIDAVNGYTCDCASGYTGGNCQTAPAQCDSGWSLYAMSCYKFHSFRNNYENAKTYCGQYGAHLVDVNSMAEMNYLEQVYLDSHSKTAVDGFWVSLNDRSDEGTWRLSDNSVATFLNWHKSQPDAQHSTDDCTQVWPNSDFQWNDVDCVYGYWFFCEYEL